MVMKTRATSCGSAAAQIHSTAQSDRTDDKLTVSATAHWAEGIKAMSSARSSAYSVARRAEQAVFVQC